jgi:HK97 family phage portal protein
MKLKNFFDFFRFRKKENPVGQLLLFGQNYTPFRRNLKAFATEGFQQNVVVYRCIKEVTNAATVVEMEIVRQLPDDEVEVISDHPMLRLLKQPNPMQSGREFEEELITHLKYSGNTYITRSPLGTGEPKELWLLRPDKMTIKPGIKGIPIAYEYHDIGGKKVFPVDQVTGYSDVLHIKETNPLDPWYGLSPLEPAAFSIDIHNEGLRWNKALLENGARPSGALQMDTSPSDDTISQMREQIENLFSGGSNAGRVPIFTDGMKWQELSMNPKDMDFAISMDTAARNISAALGVPFPLVIPTTAKFANMGVAREMLWENTVLPLLDKITNALSGWLAPQFGDENLVLRFNAETVPALEGKRARKFDRMKEAVSIGLITRDEARREIGFDEVGGAAAQLYVPSTQVPLGSEETNAEEVEKALLETGYSKDEADKILENEFYLKAVKK